MRIPRGFSRAGPDQSGGHRAGWPLSLPRIITEDVHTGNEDKLLRTCLDPDNGRANKQTDTKRGPPLGD